MKRHDSLSLTARALVLPSTRPHRSVICIKAGPLTCNQASH